MGPRAANPGPAEWPKVGRVCQRRTWASRRSKKKIATLLGSFPADFPDMSHKIWLVVSTPLKNMKVSWDHYSQYMGK